MMGLTDKEQANKDYENALDEYERALEKLLLSRLSSAPTADFFEWIAEGLAKTILCEILKEPDTDRCRNALKKIL